jgi:hypothetical protein
VGLDLTRPVFTQGQLYVGPSKATDAFKISVLLDPNQEGRRIKGLVKSVVYWQIIACCVFLCVPTVIYKTLLHMFEFPYVQHPSHG